MKTIFILIAIFLLPSKLIFAYDIRDYFPLKQDNSWTYAVIEDDNNYTYTTKITGTNIINGIKAIRMLREKNKYDDILADSEGIKLIRETEEEEYTIPNQLWIKFPNNMDIGQTKEYSVNLTTYKTNDIEIWKTAETTAISLEAMEDIEVLAGKFNNCLKFSFTRDWKKTNGNYGNEDYSIWLAPGIGKIKESYFAAEYDAESQKNSNSSELDELKFAIIEGLQIGNTQP